MTGAWVGVLADEADRESTAVFLETSVNPFHIFRATLAGSVGMCSAQAEQSFQVQQTRTVSATLLGVKIGSQDSPKAGRIFAALRDGDFQALYTGQTRTLQGKPRRGTRAQYRQSCASLRQ